ncbi:nucleotidyltransferase family protein [Paenibacillus polysaccharolyticus]|uniref:nucleotidyltransferase domain-containing protein n=1 Tax=Paenibacillus polysaccharolyticus TaxID=582692 RepID=UPI00203A66DF|nr:nucleotidyltransferase family protein [Paenibacillus polysaccharolyticus]MCM3131525.1 nucleotidyltransferase family protein [Paenibacillus polysaccharolyticus]
MLRGDLADLTSQEIRSQLHGIDWELFLQLVYHHRLYSVLYMNLKKANLPHVPETIMERLKQQYTMNTFRMLQLTAEMEQVCGAFRERGIRTITLKGPALAHDLYGDVSLRTSKDLDILIPVQEVEAAEHILTDLGYKRKEGERALTVRSWKWREHHICYIHPEKRTQVEIHWRLNPDSGRETEFELLWKRSRFSLYTHTPVRMLEREDLWVYLVTHGARHGWFRLRWLMDIDQMIRTMPLDMKKVERRMKAEGRLSIGSQTLHLASNLLNTPLDNTYGPIMAMRERTGRRLARESVMFMNDMLDSPAEMKNYQSYLFSLRSTKQKWFFFIERLYPSTWDVHQLPLPRSLFFLYFPLRPFLWFWRRFKKSTMAERGKI